MRKILLFFSVIFSIAVLHAESTSALLQRYSVLYEDLSNIRTPGYRTTYKWREKKSYFEKSSIYNTNNLHTLANNMNGFFRVIENETGDVFYTRCGDFIREKKSGERYFFIGSRSFTLTSEVVGEINNNTESRTQAVYTELFLPKEGARIEKDGVLFSFDEVESLGQVSVIAGMLEESSVDSVVTVSEMQKILMELRGKGRSLRLLSDSKMYYLDKILDICIQAGKDRELLEDIYNFLDENTKKVFDANRNRAAELHFFTTRYKHMIQKMLPYVSMSEYAP